MFTRNECHFRDELAIKEGLAEFEDHHDKILDYARAQYSKDQTFKNLITQLENEFQVTFGKIMQQDPNADSSIEEVGKSILEREIIISNKPFGDKM